MKKFGLLKEERIKSKKQFDHLYSTGKKIISKNKRLKAVYNLTDSPGAGEVKIAVAIHKKSGTAVWRNRFKRVIREAYRLNKHEILDDAKSKSKLLLIAFSSNSLNQKSFKKIKLDDVMPDVIDLIGQIKSAF